MVLLTKHFRIEREEESEKRVAEQSVRVLSCRGKRTTKADGFAIGCVGLCKMNAKNYRQKMIS